MKTGKLLAMLAVCLVVLWGSRFGPYACGTLPGFANEISSSWLAAVLYGLFAILLLYVPVYDCISLLTYKLGWEQTFESAVVYAGEWGQQPISQKARHVFYVIDLVIVVFAILPAWTKVAYCG